MLRYDRGFPGGCTRGPSPPWRFCGGCYANRKQRTAYRGCMYYLSPKSKLTYKDYSTMKRPSELPSAIPGTWTCPDPHFVKLYPSLAQGMCDPFWDDKKPRKLWRLSVGFDAQGCSLCLSCKNLNCFAYTNAPDLSEALRLLEKAVAEGTVAWRKNTR